MLPLLFRRAARWMAFILSVAPSSGAQRPPPKGSTASPAISALEARRMSEAFVQVADRIRPSVVQIDVTVRDESSNSVKELLGKGGDVPVGRGMGSGVIFSSDGAILTNDHVIEDALTAYVRLWDGRRLPARLLGRDPSTDLAVLKVDAQNLPAATFADSDAARAGEWVVAVGSPFGLGHTVTAGVVSAKGRGGLGMSLIEDYLQTDASINPGNSGGPLCDLSGRVLGINTMIVGRGTGIGFAIPSNLARRAAEQILRTGQVRRAWMGVGVQELTPELSQAMKIDAKAGALVNSVQDGSPAKRALLRPGDVLVGVGGKKVADDHELMQEILRHEVGETVELEVVRQGKRYATSVALAQRPEPTVQPVPLQQPPRTSAGLGLTVRDLQPEQASHLGFTAKALPFVTHVAPGSPADRAGLKPQDVILEADGMLEPSSMQLQQAAQDGEVVLRVRRGESGPNAGWFYAVVRSERVRP